MSKRIDIEFPVENGSNSIKGWFYIPSNPNKTPCIIMTHGFSALKEHGLDKFATVFATQGCVF